MACHHKRGQCLRGSIMRFININRNMGENPGGKEGGCRPSTHLPLEYLCCPHSPSVGGFSPPPSLANSCSALESQLVCLVVRGLPCALDEAGPPACFNVGLSCWTQCPWDEGCSAGFTLLLSPVARWPWQSLGELALPPGLPVAAPPWELAGHAAGFDRVTETVTYFSSSGEPS